jgi:hypothetical protein
MKFLYRISLTRHEAFKAVPAIKGISEEIRSLEIRGLSDNLQESPTGFISGRGSFTSAEQSKLIFNPSKTKLFESPNLGILRFNHSLNFEITPAEKAALEDITAKLAGYFCSYKEKAGHQFLIRRYLARVGKQRRKNLIRFMEENPWDNNLSPKFEVPSIQRTAKLLLKSPGSIGRVLGQHTQLEKGFATFQVSSCGDGFIFWFRSLSFLPTPVDFSYVAAADPVMKKFFSERINTPEFFQLSCFPYLEPPTYTRRMINSFSELEISIRDEETPVLYLSGKKITPLYLANHVRPRDLSGISLFLRGLAEFQSPQKMLWSWGLPLREHYPRLEAGKVIVSPERWWIEKTEFFSCARKKSWRKDRGLPDVVSLVHGNLRVDLDLDNKKLLDQVEKRLGDKIFKQLSSVLLEESVPRLVGLRGRKLEICIPF